MPELHLKKSAAPEPDVSPIVSEKKSEMLSWGLCVATLNRLDALVVCIDHAVVQTRPPAEIVIVDASENWKENSQKIEKLIKRRGIPLTYLQAPRKSLTAQRNMGIAASNADILFLIDDDSFMHPDCAAEIMKIYENSRADEILAVSASDASPISSDNPNMLKKPALKEGKRISELMNLSVFRWVWKNILMMSAERLFIPYAGPYQRNLPEKIHNSGLKISAVSLSSGYKMTVRRTAALEHQFEDAFESYSPAEDLDFLYRITRNGFLVNAKSARLYHHEVAASRIKRRVATLLSVTNVAYVIKTRSSKLSFDAFRFYIMAVRRLFAEIIKDGVSRRWNFAQTRGVGSGIFVSTQIFFKDKNDLETWYRNRQIEILKKP